MSPIHLDVRQAEDQRDLVHRAVQTLVEGGLVAFPTETVYGVAASALHPAAVERLAHTKGRQASAPFALAIKSAEEALDYAPQMGRLAQRLAERCWPGPVTLVVDCQSDNSLTNQLDPSVRQAVCPQGTVGLRVPANAVLLDVLRMLAGPLVLTSANLSGKPDATTALEVIESLGDAVALVLDDGPSRYGRPSSVVRVSGEKLEILREGVVGKATLDRLARYLVILVCTGNTCRSPMAEALLRKRLAERFGCRVDQVEERGVLVLSAGLAATPGAPASAESAQLMQEQGLSLAEHRSQPLTPQLLRHADLLLTMTRSHQQAIVQSAPRAAHKTELLLPSGEDVADPIGSPLEVYRRCAEQIDAAAAHRARQIVEQFGVVDPLGERPLGESSG